MDIITKTVLDKVQSVEGYETSVIAGGAVRDHLWGVPERDTDICIPKFEGRSAGLLIDALDKEFKVKTQYKGFDPFTFRNKDGLSMADVADTYKDMSSGRLESVLNFKFEGKDFDIVFSTYEKTEDDFDWAEKLVLDFNFGMNMVYYDGFEVKTTRSFDIDRANYQMTLINLDSISKLPGAIEKFFNISERYLEQKIVLNFNQSCLRMIKDEPAKTEVPWGIKRHKKYVADIQGVEGLIPPPAARPVMNNIWFNEPNDIPAARLPDPQVRAGIGWDLVGEGGGGVFVLQQNVGDGRVDADQLFEAMDQIIAQENNN